MLYGIYQARVEILICLSIKLNGSKEVLTTIVTSSDGHPFYGFIDNSGAINSQCC